MLKRYRFFVALMVCVCVFSCGVIGTACAEDTEFKTGTGGNCSDTLFAALKAATGKNTDTVSIDVTNITGLKFENGKITAYMSSGTSPFTVTENVPVAAITDLTGINEFTALVSLDLTGCTHSSLTSLDVTGIPGIISNKQYKIASGDNTSYRCLLYPNNITSVKCGPKFYAKQLELAKGGLKMYFYIELDENAAPTDSTMDFIVGNSSKKTTMTVNYDAKVSFDDYYTPGTNGDSNICTISSAGNDANKKTHYGFVCDVTSIQMADNIFAEFKPSSESTNTVSTNYSVKAYLDALIAQVNDEDSKVTILAKAIKDYGHYVQIPLSTLRGWTCGTGEAYDYQSMDCAAEITSKDLTTEESNDIIAKKLVCSETSLSVGCALQLDAKITLVVYIPGTVTVNNTGAISSAVNYTVNADDYKEDGKTVVTIPNLNAKALDTKYTITFDTSKTVEVYGLSYVNSVLNLTDAQKTALKSSSTNLSSLDDTKFKKFVDDLQNAVVALYRYYKAEKSYSGN